MYLSELQNKDIISVNTGVNLGRIVDAEVDSTGKVISLVAENKKLFRKFLKNSEITFTFSDITKIGTDCILVKRWKMWYDNSMKRKSLIIAIIVFLFDILIKYIVDKSFYIGTLKSIIPNFFYLTKVYNDGAAWSIFEGATGLLIGVAIISLILLILYQKSFKESKRNALAFGLVYGGLLGNLCDRISLGYVIDYLKFFIGGYEYPVFNLADASIAAGVILIIYAIYRGEDKYGNKGKWKWYKNR